MEQRFLCSLSHSPRSAQTEAPKAELSNGHKGEGKQRDKNHREASPPPPPFPRSAKPPRAILADFEDLGYNLGVKDAR